MKNNKKNKKRKNDLRHLSRKELIDLICDMRRPNPSKEAPTIEEAEKEQKRLNRRAAREFDSCIIKIVRAGRIKPVLFLSSFSLYYLVIFSDM